jgi:hypothetical protein
MVIILNMADIIKNQLSIIGIEEQIKKLLKDTNVLFSLEKLLPCKDGNDWKLNNWGCKWDVENSTIEYIDKNTVVYIFDSPWNSPKIGIRNISINYPELHFELGYVCLGNFFGNFYVKNGAIFEDYTSSFSKENILNNKLVKRNKFLYYEISSFLKEQK